MSGLNYSNHTYHLRFDGQINKFSKYKFKNVQYNTIKENTLIIEKNYFIAIGKKGSILKFIKRGKLQWSRNVYSKKEKKKIDSISLALSKGKLYAIDNLGKYYVIDVDTGEIIWVKQHKALFNSQIKIIKNKILAVDTNNILYWKQLKNLV